MFVILISSVHLTRVEQCIFSQINIPVYHLSSFTRRLRGRRHRLGTAWRVQWSQLPQDASAAFREAGPAVAPCWISPPSLAPRPTSPAYTDEMLAPREQP